MAYSHLRFDVPRGTSQEMLRELIKERLSTERLVLSGEPHIEAQDLLFEPHFITYHVTARTKRR